MFDEQPTHAVCANLVGLSAPFEVIESEDAIRLNTARLTLVIGRAPFRLDAYRADGNLVFETALAMDASWRPRTMRRVRLRILNILLTAI